MRGRCSRGCNRRSSIDRRRLQKEVPSLVDEERTLLFEPAMVTHRRPRPRIGSSRPSTSRVRSSMRRVRSRLMRVPSTMIRVQSRLIRVRTTMIRLQRRLIRVGSRLIGTGRWRSPGGLQRTCGMVNSFVFRGDRSPLAGWRPQSGLKARLSPGVTPLTPAERAHSLPAQHFQF
jgi:hypothetical protein